ncbi:MAG TPA: ComF family protein [bacterium]
MLRLASLYKRSSPYFEALLNFIYPPACIICESLPDPEKRLICETCWQKLPRLKPSAQLITHPIETGENEINSLPALGVWEFSDDVQTVIHEMKFHGKKSLSRWLGGEMAAEALRRQEFAFADALVPVPLHKTKFRERGYNQSLLLAWCVSEKLGVPVLNQVLKRLRHTKSQAKLNAVERDKNMQGAFGAFCEDLIRGKKIIVIDDVFTTGATLKACARELLNAGAANVLALTAAKTL